MHILNTQHALYLILLYIVPYYYYIKRNMLLHRFFKIYRNYTDNVTYKKQFLISFH